MCIVRVSTRVIAETSYAGHVPLGFLIYISYVVTENVRIRISDSIRVKVSHPSVT